MAKTTLTPSEIAGSFAGREFDKSAHAQQATIATATIGGKLALRKLLLKAVSTRVGTTGSAGSTTVQVHINGVAVPGCAATTANTDSDGTNKSEAPTAETIVNPGDNVELVVSAAPTAGADLSAAAVLVEVFD